MLAYILLYSMEEPVFPLNAKLHDIPDQDDVLSGAAQRLLNEIRPENSLYLEEMMQSECIFPAIETHRKARRTFLATRSWPSVRLCFLTIRNPLINISSRAILPGRRTRRPGERSYSTTAVSRHHVIYAALPVQFAYTTRLFTHQPFFNSKDDSICISGEEILLTLRPFVRFRIRSHFCLLLFDTLTIYLLLSILSTLKCPRRCNNL